MKLDNFKELLSKKAGDNDNLKLLIKYMRDDYLVDHVMESLNKMAAIYSKKNPNHALMNFGTSMDPEVEGDMIHDALGHHASQYKAALKSGDKRLADRHMQKIFDLMHMSDKLTRDGLNDHSNGKLKVEGVDPKPWERSKFADQHESGKFKTDTKGWARSTKERGPDNAWHANFDWLRGLPHDSYNKETDVHGHKDAYPLEQIKVNGKHIHVDPDAEYNGEFIEHPFDSHPIMSNFRSSPKDYTSENHAKYLQDVDAYNAPGGGADSYWDLIEPRGEGHYGRGSKVSDAVHEPVKRLSGDEAMQRLAEITGSNPGQAKSAKVPTLSTQPSSTPSEGKLSAEEAMKRLNQITGKK